MRTVQDLPGKKKSVCEWTHAVQTHVVQGSAVSKIQIMIAGFLTVRKRSDRLGNERMMID